MSGTTWPTAEPKLQFIGQRQPLTPRRCAPGLAPGLSTQVLGYDYPTLDPSADPLVRQFWAREAAWVAEVGRRSHQSAFCSNKTGAGLLARLRLIDTCSHAQELSVRRQQRKFPFRAFVLRDGVIGPGTLTLTLTRTRTRTRTLNHSPNPNHNPNPNPNPNPNHNPNGQASIARTAPAKPA